MEITKSRIDYFLDKKDNEYNPNLDSFNLLAKGYNKAIKDVKKEIENIAKFEEITHEETFTKEQLKKAFNYGWTSNWDNFEKWFEEFSNENKL